MMILGWLWIRVKCERLAFGLVKRIESHMLKICGSRAERLVFTNLDNIVS